MKKIVRLTESDLVRLVKRVISEQSSSEMTNAKALQLAFNRSAGGSSENQLRMLVQNGFLTTTRNERISPENAKPGIYKFSNVELPSAMSTPNFQELKYLVNYVKQKGISPGDIVDVIMDYPMGTRYGK